MQINQVWTQATRHTIRTLPKSSFTEIADVNRTLDGWLENTIVCLIGYLLYRVLINTYYNYIENAFKLDILNQKYSQIERGAPNGPN